MCGGNGDVEAASAGYDDEEAAAARRERGINVLTVDPTDREGLLDARADTAVGIVAPTDDATNTSRSSPPSRPTETPRRRGTSDTRHVDEPEEVGADVVFSPAVIGGRLLGRSVADPDARTVGAETAADDSNRG